MTRRIRFTTGSRVSPGRGAQHRLMLIAATDGGPRAWTIPWGRYRPAGDPRLPVRVVLRTPRWLWRWIPW